MVLPSRARGSVRHTGVAGAPERWSSTWWADRPPFCQVRLTVLEVASAPPPRS
jgi:hypothetical protein